MWGKSIFNVPEITCSGCSDAIKNSPGKLEAVRNVDVQIDEKRVSVFHKLEIGPDELVQAFELVGFTAVKAEDRHEITAS
ncbi:MAG: hypothetical protein C4324_09200 [Blastocatellia bacterium]